MNINKDNFGISVSNPIQENNIKIIAVGDIQLGDSPISFGFGIRSKYDKNYSLLIKDNEISKIIKNADIVSGNLESSFDNYEKLKFDQNALSVNKNAILFLRDLGFNLLNLANNHTLERGTKGVLDLLDILDNLNVFYTGLNGKHYVHDFYGKKIVFLNYTNIRDFKNENILNIWNDNEFINIENISKKADFLILNIHWGYEFVPFPAESQILLGHRLIDSGVNIIIGHHPHVIQPIERYKGGIIAYSLGNFLFDGLYSGGTGRTAMVFFDIELKTKNIVWDVIPLVIHGNFSLGIDRRERNARQLFDRQVNIMSASIYKKEVLKKRWEYRYSTLKYLILNFYKYKDKKNIIRWIINRAVLILKNRKKENQDPADVYLWRK